VFPGFKRAKRYKYFSFEIDAFRKLNEVVLRLKHWAVELCESVEKYSVNLMLKKKSSYIIASSNKRAFKCKYWKNRTMLFGRWWHDDRTLCDCIKITQTLKWIIGYLDNLRDVYYRFSQCLLKICSCNVSIRQLLKKYQLRIISWSQRIRVNKNEHERIRVSNST